MKLSRLTVWIFLLLMINGTVSAMEEEQPMFSREKMAEMQKLMFPSEAHEVLKAFEGSWDYTGYFWMSPDSEPQAMEGSAENEIIFDGRFLKQEFFGAWMGQDFEGIGYTGYDNVREEYVSIWFDNMATGIMNVTGDYSPETKTLRFSGQFSCPMTGETHRTNRSEWTVLDENTNTYTSYMSTLEGVEYKAMEITYTRS